MTKKKEYDPEVPLFLIATAIAGGVKQRGGKLFRISVVRTAAHQYLIKYTCRAKEGRIPRTARQFPGWIEPEGTSRASVLLEAEVQMDRAGAGEQDVTGHA
jgi:hypothetical protein